MRLLLVGDCHGDLDFLNRACQEAKKNNCELIFQLGDWGYCWDGRSTIPAVDAILETHGLHMAFCEGNHDCVTEDTRAVTQRGFISWTELLPDDLVLTVNDQGVRQWDPILEIKSYPYIGPIVYCTGNKIDLAMTPNHRFVYRTLSPQKTWRELLAAELQGVSGYVVVGALNNDADYPISDPQIRLAAWCCTDSWISKEGYWHFSQGKRKVNRILSLLNDLKIDYTLSERQRDTSEICGKKLLTTPDIECRIYIPAEFSRQISYDKNALPSWVGQLSKRQADILIEELVWTDGTMPTNGVSSRVIYCSRKSLREQIQWVAIANGYRAHFTEYRPGHWRINLSQYPDTIFDFRDKNVYAPTNKIEQREYSGTVWCLRVPSGRFFVERNNKVVLTGNSYYQLQALGLWGATEPAPASDKNLCFYYPRGYRWSWDGVRFLSLGGAVSVDRGGPGYRGRGWFKEEEITEADIIRCGTDPVDVMLTHDAPYGVPPLESFLQLTEDFWPKERLRASLANRKRVQAVVDAVQPRLLSHGHFHWRYSGEYPGENFSTKIEGLNCNFGPLAEGIYVLDTSEFSKEDS